MTRLGRKEEEFRERVRSHADRLPPQQRVIADHLAEHLREVPFLSVPELAARIGASEATIVRFAQRIGYSGFAELKMDVLDAMRSRVVDPSAVPDLADDGRDVLAAVARLEVANVQRTLATIDRAAFAAAAAELFGAAHVFTFGLGVSAQLAELAAYSLVQIGVRATALSTGFSSPREQLVVLDRHDLLWTFSFPPYSPQTVTLHEEAERRGIPSLAVTDRATAPVARAAGRLLVVQSENVLVTNAVAAATVVVNALATEIAVRHQGHAVEALSHLNRILTEDVDGDER